MAVHAYTHSEMEIIAQSETSVDLRLSVADSSSESKFWIITESASKNVTSIRPDEEKS